MTLSPTLSRNLIIGLAAGLLLALAAIAWLLLRPAGSSAAFDPKGLVQGSLISEGKDVLFTIDGKKVHKELIEGELDLMLAQAPPEMAARFKADIAKKQQALESMQTQYLLLMDAQQKNLFTNRDFHTYLRKVVRDSSVQFALMALAGGDQTVTDEEVANYYNQNKNMFPGGFDSNTEIQLRAMLKQQKMQEVVMKKISEIKSRHPVTVNDAVDLYGIKSGK